MKTLVCANQKGGATKTSTAAHLAAGAAIRGHRTVLVDLDGQCNLTELFGLSPDQLKADGHYSVLDVVLGKRRAEDALLQFPDRFGGNLYLIPGHPSMSNVGSTLELAITKAALEEEMSPLEAEERKDQSRLQLRDQMKSLGAPESLEGPVDLVVFDPPPSLGFELMSALAAADAYVVPMTPNKFDVSGLKRLTKTVQLTKRRYNAALEFLGVVLGRFRKGTTLHRKTVEGLQARFPDHLLEPFISESIRFGECPYHSKTIYELIPGEAPAEDFMALTDLVLAKLFGAEAKQPEAPVHSAPQPEPEITMGEVGNG